MEKLGRGLEAGKGCVRHVCMLRAGLYKLKEFRVNERAKYFVWRFLLIKFFSKCGLSLESLWLLH